MNKDIQSLIQREACEHWSQSNYKEVSEKAHSENDMCKTSAMARKVSNSSFQAGASFALSLFKWRKVSEMLPDADEAVLCKMKSPSVIVEGFIYNDNGVPKISTQADFEFEDYANGEVIEWMPIPQID